MRPDWLNKLFKMVETRPISKKEVPKVKKNAMKIADELGSVSWKDKLDGSLEDVREVGSRNLGIDVNIKCDKCGWKARNCRAGMIRWRQHFHHGCMHMGPMTHLEYILYFSLLDRLEVLPWNGECARYATRLEHLQLDG